MSDRSHPLLAEGVATRTPRSQVEQLSIPPAVQFGQGVRDSRCKAFPFFYNFVRYPYQQGIANPTTGIYTITGDSAEGPDGLPIAAGGRLNIPIVMDDDYPFHLLYVKYGAFYRHSYSTTLGEANFIPPAGLTMVDGMHIIFSQLANLSPLTVGQLYYVVNADAFGFDVSLTQNGAAISPAGASGTYVFTLIANTNANFNGSRSYADYNPADAQLILNAYANRYIPYYTELDVSLYFPSSGSRDLYGGFQRAPLLGATQEEPIQIGSLQGKQDGHASLRTPYQLPAGAHVNIVVGSRSSFPLQVYGHLFGYKITV